MDILPTDWLHDLEMEESNLIRQCQVDSVDYSLDEINFTCFSPEVYASLSNESTHTEINISKLGKELKTNNDNSHDNGNAILLGQSSSPSTNSLQNENPNEDDAMSQDYINFSSFSSRSSQENLNERPKSCNRTKKLCATSRAPVQARNHILAERKRRERLNQKLISLSTLIPGLKKMDKASILQDAIKYIKHLQEHVQTLEKRAKKKLVEPTIHSMTKCGPSWEDDNVSSNENLDENFKKLSPEIEVRILEKNVLFRIHCKKNGDVVAKILSKMSALHLDVVSSSVLPFGVALEITIVAQVDEEFHMTVEDLVKNLRSVVLSFL
ncbi:transcription factor bHLH25-like [Camellia sinensis]|nr:transcription factor bHLH25-like [Camellia sinensis]XP_028122460.1 transcription factor bHLH25-like [Camellia sinensis]XP_028122461.1 transcription factor bHLH25-like [Camellia sinensis]